MPITLENFKDYVGFYREEVPAVQSLGLIVITRKDLSSQDIIMFSDKTFFRTQNDIAFKALTALEINESRQFIEATVHAVNGGQSGNLPANVQWQSPFDSEFIDTVVVTNPGPFMGGIDVIPAMNRKGVLNRMNIPSDYVLQLMLDHSQIICMKIIGNPSQVPATPTFESGVYFLGRYYLETRSKLQSQDSQDVIKFWESRIVNPGIEDMKVHAGVMRILTGMLSADRQVTAFMPEVQSESS